MTGWRQISSRLPVVRFRERDFDVVGCSDDGDGFNVRDRVGRCLITSVSPSIRNGFNLVQFFHTPHQSKLAHAFGMDTVSNTLFLCGRRFFDVSLDTVLTGLEPSALLYFGTCIEFWTSGKIEGWKSLFGCLRIGIELASISLFVAGLVS